jgi:hypothetical protein
VSAEGGSAPGRPHEIRRRSFYRRLSAAQKREYDRSDTIRSLSLRPAAVLGDLTNALVAALAAGKAPAVRRAAQSLVEAVVSGLPPSRGRRLPPAPTIKVLRTRPRSARAELHGLYTRFADGRSEIRVWLFTAAHGKLVKPRTFLRTLLHEVCHHLDMTVLDLPHSLHTLGFHARESSLVRALEGSGGEVPGGRTLRPPARLAPAIETRPVPPAGRMGQLDLFRGLR